MSSSSAHTPRYSGRVLIGCDTPGAGFVSIQSVEGNTCRPVWDERAEADYMDRCRKKAQGMAREIIAQAMQKAAEEAEVIRGQARAEVDRAVAEAQEQLNAEFSSQAQAMAALLDSLQGAGCGVWRAKRRDFAALAKSFTKKALAVEMDSRRAEILEKLMDEACEHLDSQREFTLRVAPQDFELARAFMEEIAARRPDLGAWKLAADGALAQGGVVVETPEMLADNAVESRLAVLEPYLEQLGLPEDLNAAENAAEDAENEPRS